MREGLAQGVFPGAVLHVRAAGEVRLLEAWGHANIFSGQAMTPGTVFDLASLTKPLATAPAVLKLTQEGRPGLEDRLGDILPDFSHLDKHEITLADLLRHRSGYPAHREYFRTLAAIPWSQRKAALSRLLAAEPLAYPPGQKTVYSDLGYMVLRQVVETVSRQRLDCFVRQAIYEPLGVEGLFFPGRPHSAASMAARVGADFAATEQCPRRKLLLQGLVHDDNAYEIGGIDGQAGLFGTVTAVARFLEVLLEIYDDNYQEQYQGQQKQAVFTSETVRSLLIPRHKGQRPLGFDVPEESCSSSGTLFSKLSAGHLGFTGTSMWLDIPRRVMVLLFTNRVHPDRSRDAIKFFRPELHQAVMEDLLRAGV